MSNYDSVPFSRTQAHAMRSVLKQLRRKGLSIGHLAHFIGTSPRNISNFLREDIANDKGHGSEIGAESKSGTLHDSADDIAGNSVPATSKPPRPTRDPDYRIWLLYCRYASTLLANNEYPELAPLLKRAIGRNSNRPLSALSEIVPDCDIDEVMTVGNIYGGLYYAYYFTYFSDVSHISVTALQLHYDKEHHTLNFAHRYGTRYGGLRTAVGHVISCDRTLTVLGAIENTSSMLAAIIQRNPTPENKFTYLHGMLLCPNRNGDPFACKLLLQKKTDVAVDLSDYESMIQIVCLEPHRLRDETDEAFSKRKAYIGGLEERNILRFIRNETPGPALTLYPILYYY